MAIEIDWPGLRAACVAIGVREAGRRAAAVLPEDERERFVERLMRRCSREKWLAVKSEPKRELAKKPPSAPVRNGSDALQAALSDDSRATKMGFSTAARKVAEKVAGMRPSLNKDRAKAVRDWASTAGSVHGWDQGKSAGVQFKLLQIGGTLTLVSEGQGGGQSDGD